MTLFLLTQIPGIFLAFTITWLIALKIRIAAIVDVLWAASFSIMAFLYWLRITPQPTAPLPILILLLITIWSIRLALYLAIRICKHGKKEDTRYAALKEKWGKRTAVNLFLFYQLQGILIFILSLTFLFVFLNATAPPLPQHYIGIALALIAIIGETTSDAQLSQFKTRHPQSICNTGLWKYSRHPNYFFQWLAWCAWAILATQPHHPISLLSWLAPAIIYLLLRHVSGIPLTEKLMLQKYGPPYQNYLNTTSAFFPFPPHKK
jgi:steroid 5-alpha reductase family enzyme